MVTPSVIQSILDSRLHDRVRLGEMLAGIDAQDVVGLQDVERQHTPPHGDEMFGGVRQVIFALSVAGADLVESIPEIGQLEDIATRD